MVTYVKGGASVQTTAGQLKPAIFPNPHALNYLRDGIYAETVGSGAPILEVPGMEGSGQILGGFLEQSNVNIFRQRVRLRFLTEWRAALMRALAQRKN